MRKRERSYRLQLPIMDSILKLIPEIIKLSGNQEEVCEKAIYATWNALVGEQVRRNCAPVRLFKKTLYVAAKDAIWRKQLEQMSGQILFKLNSVLGAAYITRLEFRVNPKLIKDISTESSSVEFGDLSTREAELAPAAAEIKDDELRNIFVRAAGKCMERAAR
ncbi:MAG TPA: DUF721 domain-containing protein [Blastocatellia bacterium]|nr:DUF721 domain-containing protein [Blastocatellia bacterium]